MSTAGRKSRLDHYWWNYGWIMISSLWAMSDHHFTHCVHYCEGPGEQTVCKTDIFAPNLIRVQTFLLLIWSVCALYVRRTFWLLIWSIGQRVLNQDDAPRLLQNRIPNGSAAGRGVFGRGTQQCSKSNPQYSDCSKIESPMRVPQDEVCLVVGHSNAPNRIPNYRHDDT